MTFANKLKKLRNENGWSQEKLGELINIHPRLISKYERGKNYPAAETLIKLAKIFCVSIDFLILDKDKNEKIMLKLKDTRLLKQFNELDKMKNKDKKIIISLIDAYIAKIKNK